MAKKHSRKRPFGEPLASSEDLDEQCLAAILRDDVRADRIVDAVTDAVQSGVVTMKVWRDHLDSCEQCQKAIRGRFASATLFQMAAKCCDVGRPLYQSFIERVK